MSIHVANLGLAGVPGAPAIGNLRGGNPAKRSHVTRMLEAQDQALGASCRVVWQSGLQGSPQNSVGDCHISETSDQIKAHPYIDDSKVIGRVERFRLTPGHVLAVSARCLPSGQVQASIPAEPVNSQYDGGQSGKLSISTTWRSPGEGNLPLTVDVDFNGSGQSEFGHCGHATQSGFAAVVEKYTLVMPWSMLADPSEVEKYSREGVEVDLEVSNVGGLRPVDICIFEIPFKVAFDDSTSNKVPAQVFQNNEVPIGGYAPEYAIEGQASGDPRQGVEWINDAMLCQSRAINPACLSWHSHSEAVPWDTDEDSGLALPNGVEIGWLVFDAAGLCYGQRYHNSNNIVMPDTGCVLVGVSVYHENCDGTDLDLFLRDYGETTDSLAHFDAFTDSTVTAQWDHFSVLVETGDSVLDVVPTSIRFLASSSGPAILNVTLRVIPELE